MLNSLSRVEQGDRASSSRNAIALSKILLERGDHLVRWLFEGDCRNLSG
jgi:hypothetical protein